MIGRFSIIGFIVLYCDHTNSLVESSLSLSLFVFVLNFHFSAPQIISGVFAPGKTNIIDFKFNNNK